MLDQILNQIEAALKDGNYDQDIINEWHDQYYNTNLAEMHIPCLFSLEAILRLMGIKNGTESRVIVVATQIALNEHEDNMSQDQADFIIKLN